MSTPSGGIPLPPPLDGGHGRHEGNGGSSVKHCLQALYEPLTIDCWKTQCRSFSPNYLFLADGWLGEELLKEE